MDIIIPIIALIAGIAWLKYILTPPSAAQRFCPIRRPDKRARVITE